MPTLVLAIVALVIAVAALVTRSVEGKRPTRLPGPPALPLLGSRWLFWSRYKMNKLHEAYEGKIVWF